MKKRNKAAAFSKQPSCPSSETLHDFARDLLPASARRGLGLHLAHCDFCAAELHLLSSQPPPRRGPRVKAQVPLWVRLFARRLLQKNTGAARHQRRRAA